jgi:lysophospholipase L1-like esterase
MTTSSILKKKYSFKGKTMSVFEAVDNVSPRGVFIMLGANDLSCGVKTEKFSENYSELVDKLREACPDANIYIQSVIPVTEKYSAKNKMGFTNENIKQYNETLKKLCDSKNAVFLNIGEVLSNGTGVLPEKSSSDGYHLKSLVYSDWMTFLKNEK